MRLWKLKIKHFPFSYINEPIFKYIVSFYNIALLSLNFSKEVMRFRIKKANFGFYVIVFLIELSFGFFFASLIKIGEVAFSFGSLLKEH